MSAKSTPPLAPLQLPAKIADVATGMIFKTKRPTAPRSTVPKRSRRPTPETRIKTALGKAQRKIAPPVALESAATEDSDFVDAPPLIPDESLMAHQALLARVTNAVAPKDIHEEIWVRDVVDLVWDCIRLRRLKLNFLATSARQRLEQVPPPLREADLCSLGGYPATITSQAWGRQEPKDLDLVNRRLASSGLSMEAVMAATQAMHLDSFERMIASAEARRDTAPRELSRHRKELGALLRRAGEEEEGADLKEIASTGCDDPALDQERSSAGEPRQRLKRSDDLKPLEIASGLFQHPLRRRRRMTR